MRSKINGISVDYSLDGPKHAPPVVLIHGFPFSRAMWKAQVNVLKLKFRVLSYDLRGMGHSSLGKAPQLLEAYVDDLFALLDHLKIKQAALCGLSMGGYIALRATQREGARVTALALCDTRADGDGDEAKLKRAAGIKLLREKGVKSFALGMIPNLLLSEGKVRAGLLKIICANKADGMANALAAMAGRTDSTGFLNDIKVQTLVMLGAEDKLAPLAMASTLAGRIPNCRLVTLPSAGHVSNLDNPGDFNLELNGFLKGALC